MAAHRDARDLPAALAPRSASSACGCAPPIDGFDATCACLTRELVPSTREVFAAHGLELGRSEELGAPKGSWHDAVAMIGFVGPSIAGSLALSAPLELLRELHPLRSTSRADLLDMLRELSNLTLGRMKRAVAPVMTLRAGLPAAVAANGIRVTTSAVVSSVHVIDARTGLVLVGLDLAKTRATPDLSPPESELEIDEVTLF